MNNIPLYAKYEIERKIALLDNSAIQFMSQLNFNNFDFEDILKPYDVLLIPQWVMHEVKDGDHRLKFVNILYQKGYPIKIIDETTYTILMDYKELDLYQIFRAVSDMQGTLKGYLRRHIEKDDPLDMDPFEEWVQTLYDQWPIEGKATSAGRDSRKNAGEISLVTLAEIFSWCIPHIESITVFSQDYDAYAYQKRSNEILQKHWKDKNHIGVSFISNDAMICQLYRLGKLAKDNILTLRPNARKLTYTLGRADNSTLLETKLVNTPKFLELMDDPSFRVVF